MKKEKKSSRKHIAIVKISNKSDGKAQCVKYRFDNLIKFTIFLDKQWADWKWFNVYSNKGSNKGEQIGNYTKYRRPM
jgi:hypothetical protein